MMVVSLQPDHDAIVMELVAARKTADVDGGSVLVEADGAVGARDPLHVGLVRFRPAVVPPNGEVFDVIRWHCGRQPQVGQGQPLD